MKLHVGPQLARGQILYQQKRYAAAVEELRVASVSDLSDPIAPAYLALAHSGLGNASEAMEAAREAVSREPDSAFAHLALGYAFFISGRIGPAHEAGLESLRHAPESVDAHVLLARLAEATEDWPEALSHAYDALAINPFDGRAALVQGRAFVATGQAGEAIEALRTGLCDNPEYADLHSELGWACLNCGNHAEALSHLREALRLNPLSDRSRNRLAEALKSKNVVYRLILRTILWFGRRHIVNKITAMAIVVAYAVIFLTAAMMGWLAFPWIVAGIGLGLAAWTWQRLSVPIFDLFLQFDPFGRHLLTGRERAAAWTVAVCIAWSALMVVLAVIFHHGLLLLAVANATVVPWLLHLTFIDHPVSRRRVRLLFFSPGIVSLDVGLTLAALADLDLLHESIATFGGTMFVIGIIGTLVGAFLLTIVVPVHTA